MSVEPLSEVMLGFTKKEAIELSGMPFHRVGYLDRSKILSPKRFNLPGQKRPLVRYSFTDVLELRAIHSLRENASLQAIRALIKFISEHSQDPRLSSKRILVLGEEIYWIKPDLSDLGEVVAVATVKNPGQLLHCELTILPDLKEEILKNAKESKIVDFESFMNRAKEYVA